MEALANSGIPFRYASAYYEKLFNIIPHLPNTF